MYPQLEHDLFLAGGSSPECLHVLGLHWIDVGHEEGWPAKGANDLDTVKLQGIEVCSRYLGWRGLLLHKHTGW